ncbi:MAG: peptidylprolyl isomerase [Gammaproteobacteria bacterium]
MKIDHNCIVSIRYKLTNERDEALDESPEGEPLVYMHGAAGVLPALESALAGKGAGENFDVTISPAEGFGDHQPALIQTVPRSSFPDDVVLEVGIQINMHSDQGDQQATVTALNEDSVTIDANHPLAGMTLRFQGTVEEIRAATDEEIRHWPNPVPAEAPTNGETGSS